MCPVFKKLARLAVLACLLLTPTAPGKSTAAAPADPDSHAALAPETRLRKLHLVRPDLIPYPVMFEVYC